MSQTIFVLSGPNLNMLGTREPHLYGTLTLAQVETDCQELCASLGLELVFRQSNAEYEIIEWLQECRARAASLVINPAGLSFHAVGVLDALLMIEQPIIEVHITNLHRREEPWRAHSIMTTAVTAMMTGFGVHGYSLAIRHLAFLLKARA